jgi:hypothetical protein
MNSWASSAIVAAACAGCAGYTVPSQHVTGAQTSIASARGGGATADPQAALHLKLAEDQYSAARRLMSRGDLKDERQADLLLLRAQADAQLAQSLAQETAAKGQAEQTLEQIRILMDQSAPRQ